MKLIAKFLTLVFLLLQLTSCGDLFESAQEAAPIGGVISANCDLGDAANEIKNFFDEDVSSSIECIHANFRDFIKLVRSEKPGFLSKKELIHFISSRDLVQDPEETLNYIKVLFMISKLIFGSDGDYISQDNLNKLVDFAKILNINGIIISDYFKDEENRTFAYHKILKQGVEVGASSVANALDNLLKRNRTRIDSIDVNEVLGLFKFKDENNKLKIMDLLFLKSVLLGGDSNIISHLELQSLTDLNKIPSLATVIFDVLKLNKLSFQDDKDRYALYKNDLRELICNFHFNDSRKRVDSKCDKNSQPIYGNPIVFKTSDLLKALKWFEEDLGVPIHKYPEVILKFKDIFFTGTTDFYAEDFNKFLSLTDDILDMGQYFVIAYNHFKVSLDKETRLVKSVDDYKICKELSVQFPQLFDRNTNGTPIYIEDPKLNCGANSIDNDFNQSGTFEEFKFKLDQLVIFKSKYAIDFNRIAKNYRFFRSTNWDMPYFKNGFKRSATGMFELRMIEVIMEKVFRYYEKNMPCDDPTLVRKVCDKEDNNATLHLGQVMEIIDFFKGPLYDLKIVLEGREDISAENTQLMSALFQYQSDQNGLMDVNEATEFATGIFAVGPLGNDIHDQIVKKCIDQNDLKEVVEEFIDERGVPRKRRLKTYTLPSGKVDEFGRIEVACFRKNFFPVFAGLKNSSRPEATETMRDSFIKLFQYTDDLANQDRISSQSSNNSNSKVEDFVLTIERFTRPCKGDKWEDISISKEDMIGIMGGIYNVESTVNRYDVNGNNVMDADEVDVAYDIYEGAVKGIIAEMEMADFFKKIAMGLHKQIFLYMIKENKVPAVDADFLKFLVSFKWKAEAKRETIAGILRNIALQSKTSQSSTFDCNTVRYPQQPPILDTFIFSSTIE